MEDNIFDDLYKQAKAEFKTNAKVENALNTFKDELRKAILNEDLDMTFNPYNGDIDGYWADIIVKVSFNFEFGLSLNSKGFVCVSHYAGLDDLFNDENDFKALEAMTLKHIQPLTDADKARIKELETEINNIKMKKAS